LPLAEQGRPGNISTIMSRKGQTWTPAEDTKLRELAAANVPVRNIALKLQRSEDSIHSRARHLNVKVQPNVRRRSAPTG
jgi:hypothetical protein